MDIEILEEGWKDDLLKMIGMNRSARLKRQIKKLSRKKQKMINSSGILKDIEKINKLADEIVDGIYKLTGKRYDITHYKLTDFIDKEVLADPK
tara:strand:+ start:506 stop:784 length:279 start_codon:yes stop_codon:yes gene_type:complete